ncbi:hypothetical protein ccrud_04885 [Corynebacterium crudilactis]|uniref:Uncharacterized protein n=1 Tax=Corynebacterium crudilactis TaxID=1652495 RepID=A0A172QSG8_9CORY|nr:hypothetical protein ccrud_04885 [Corynebacterium crudilactis]
MGAQLVFAYWGLASGAVSVLDGEGPNHSAHESGFMVWWASLCGLVESRFQCPEKVPFQNRF